MSSTCLNCTYLDLECGSYDSWGRRYYLCKYNFSYHYSNENACSHFSQGSACYLTSACVGYLGKPDDCYELTTLRAFRDGYLKGTAEGDALVKQYYEVAPKIVEQIEATGKQQQYYEYIYDVVKQCVACIENGDQEGALSRYRDMTLKLQSELLSK